MVSNYALSHTQQIEYEYPEPMQLKEELYIGNLHHNSRHHHNNHCWSMFISKSPTDVVPPLTIKSVTYHLHETFRPNVVTVEEAPFYLDRIGWGYFSVTADIIFKPGYYPLSLINEDEKLTTIKAVHSIHFGSPLVTHHILSDLPYVSDSDSLQKIIVDQTSQRFANSLKRRARAVAKRNRLNRERNRNENDNNDDDEEEKLENEEEEEEESDIEDIDIITKQYIPEIILSGFVLTRNILTEELNKYLADRIPKVVISLIVEYTSIYSIGGDDDDDKMDKNELLQTRIILEDCFAIQFVVYCPILELVVINCGGCDIQTSNIGRSMRIYNSKSINLYTKGECTSYRFEKCNKIKVEALDTRKRVIFMSLFCEELCFKMFNAYYPNDESKCVAEFASIDMDTNSNDDDDVIVDECYLTVFSVFGIFGKKTPFSTMKGTTLIPLIRS